jgi:antitoxin ParD1/3/4
MNVSLTPELEMLVEAKVKEGLYSTASEVVREALRYMRERDEERLAKLDAIRQAVAVGLTQVDEGQGVSGPAAFARIRSSVSQATSGR